jgi:hypothetical protein
MGCGHISGSVRGGDVDKGAEAGSLARTPGVSGGRVAI